MCAYVCTVDVCAVLRENTGSQNCLCLMLGIHWLTNETIYCSYMQFSLVLPMWSCDALEGGATMQTSYLFPFEVATL